MEKEKPRPPLEEQIKADDENLKGTFFTFNKGEPRSFEGIFLKPVKEQDHSLETKQKLNEIKAEINAKSSSPVAAALEVEHIIPPHPSVEELGTSITREIIPAMREELVQLLSQIDFSGENIDLEDLKNKLNATENLLRTQIDLLQRDSDKNTDVSYVDFLQRMENEVRIAQEKIKKLDTQMFGRDVQEKIVLAEFKIKAELQAIFPNENIYDLLHNPKKTSELIREKFKINDAPDLKLGFSSHVKSLMKGWKGGTLAAFGGATTSLAGFMGYAATVLESPAFIYFWPIAGGATGVLVSLFGLMYWNWSRKESLTKDMVNHVEKIKEKVKEKYFPPNKPKPQFNK